VKFRCDFILHFAESSSGGTAAQIFEQVPLVWPGMYWMLSHSGPGRYRDIRFVEPTVWDRVAALDMLDAILRPDRDPGQMSEPQEKLREAAEVGARGGT
jgi:hypothetical protein